MCYHISNLALAVSADLAVRVLGWVKDLVHGYLRQLLGEELDIESSDIFNTDTVTSD